MLDIILVPADREEAEEGTQRGVTRNNPRKPVELNRRTLAMQLGAVGTFSEHMSWKARQGQSRDRHS